MSLIKHFSDDYACTTPSTETVYVPLDLDKTTKNVTRVEIIDQKGRSYVNWNKNNSVKILIQDNGKTMKIVITNKKNSLC